MRFRSDGEISNCQRELLSVEQRGQPRHGQQGEQQDGDDPEGEPLPAARARIGAGRAWGADLRHQVKIAEGQAEKQQRQADEDRPVRLHCRQAADPGAADAEGQQHERPDAAHRCADGGEDACDQ